VDGFVVKLGGGCVPSGNEDLATGNSCTDTLDNDCDGAIDAADSGCTAPPTEICNNTTDDDGDGAIDCADTDCAGDPACPGTEICNNTTDDDGDGAIDCADSDCTGDPACPAPTCKDYAYYFGPAATDQNLAVAAGSEYVITMRNLAASLGFQLGVKATTAGNSTTWEFSGALGADANRLIELIVTDDQGNSKTPEAGNKATSDQSTVSDVVRGAATAGFSNGDFLGIDLAPGVGGPGFTVGYVTELNPQGGQTDKIPATGAGAPCPVNEILKVQLGVVAPGKFSRGDANGDSKINVTDAVLIIQIVVGNIQAKFDCQDALDANDDGQVNVADAVPVLSYVFQRGPDLPEPFKKCAADPTNDALTCTQANCQ
ncbi:MAG TPA: dockerin type I repeat-containing protein, partial [Planctomycetota bacterium]|nr:dockerin type I repeat-containing protein [Planctomycetota bacterium]